jgi:hypothetical protein
MIHLEIGKRQILGRFHSCEACYVTMPMRWAEISPLARTFPVRAFFVF